MDICLSKESFGFGIICFRSVLCGEPTSKSKTLLESGVGVGVSHEAVESSLKALVTRSIITSADGDTAKGGGMGREWGVAGGVALRVVDSSNGSSLIVVMSPTPDGPAW